jgi:hypothetical protein
MRRAVTIIALVFLAGCTTYQKFGDRDELGTAALRAIGAEQVAWLTHNTAVLPSGMDSLVTLKKMTGRIDSINTTDRTVTATYWYTGTFTADGGQRDGTLTVQRRLHFQRGDTGKWTLSAPAEEIARNAQWSSPRRTS